MREDEAATKIRAKTKSYFISKDFVGENTCLFFIN
jgi:hypothetical protein